MKLRTLFKHAVAIGIDADPRGRKAVEKLLKKQKERYDKLPKDDKEFADEERTWNPFSDCRIIHGTGEEELRSLMVGIDIEPPEILLADRLREKGHRIDGLLIHHPEGRALADLEKVMPLQADLLAAVGVPINHAEAMLRPRMDKIWRAIHSDNLLRTERTAELLGFDGVHVNTLDAVQDADHALETYGVVAMLAAHLERLGEDLAYWSGTEAGYVDIADRFASASSILMQMKTPTPPSYARSAFASIVGGMMGAYLGAKGSTGMLANLGPLEHSFAEVHRSLRLLTPALASVRVDAPRARRQAGLHFAAGTDLAAALVVERGLPWRSAHQICGILFRLCAERSLTPSDVSPALLDEAAVDYFGRPVGLAAEVIQDALDPLSFVQRRTLLGGPAPAETLRQVEVLNQALERDRRWLDAARDAVKQSAQRLDAAIDALLEG